MAHTAKSPPASSTGGTPNALSCRLAEGSSDHKPIATLPQDLPSRERDARLLGLDYLAELGDSLVVAGAAIAAAASAENVTVVEAALRQARGVLMDAIGEFKSLPPQDGDAL